MEPKRLSGNACPKVSTEFKTILKMTFEFGIDVELITVVAELKKKMY